MHPMKPYALILYVLCMTYTHKLLNISFSRKLCKFLKSLKNSYYEGKPNKSKIKKYVKIKKYAMKGNIDRQNFQFTKAFYPVLRHYLAVLCPSVCKRDSLHLGIHTGRCKVFRQYLAVLCHSV